MEAMKHEDFYKRLRKRVTRWAKDSKIKASYRDALLALPDLFHLMCRMVLDKRVANTDKAILGVGIAYVISPLDLIPDLLGPFGFLDDLLVAAIVLDTVFKRVPGKVITEHWAGSDDVMDLVRRTVNKADDWFGKGLYKRVRNFIKESGVMGEPWAAEPEAPPAAKPKARPRAKATAKKAKTAKTVKTTKKTAKKKIVARTAKPRAKKRKA